MLLGVTPHRPACSSPLVLGHVYNFTFAGGGAYCTLPSDKYLAFSCAANNIVLMLTRTLRSSCDRSVLTFDLPLPLCVPRRGAETTPPSQSVTLAPTFRPGCAGPIRAVGFNPPAEVCAAARAERSVLRWQCRARGHISIPRCSDIALFHSRPAGLPRCHISRAIALHRGCFVGLRAQTCPAHDFERIRNLPDAVSCARPCVLCSFPFLSSSSQLLFSPEVLLTD